MFSIANSLICECVNYCDCQVERADCQFLLIHGTDDMSSGVSTVTKVPERLEAHGKTNYRVLLYEGAGHLIEPPHSPHYYATYHGLFGENICL